MSEPIELNPAYSWDCPNCGKPNFERGCVPEMSEEELAELRDEHGLLSYDAGLFVQMPDEVTCPGCGEKFDTMHREDGQT